MEQITSSTLATLPASLLDGIFVVNIATTKIPICILQLALSLSLSPLSSSHPCDYNAAAWDADRDHLTLCVDVNHFQFRAAEFYAYAHSTHTRSHVRKQLNRYFWCNDCAVYHAKQCKQSQRHEWCTAYKDAAKKVPE